MVDVSAEFAVGVLKGASAGDPGLRLDVVYSEDDSPWLTPAYRFDILVRGSRAGTISLRIGNDERMVRYAGHIGYGVNEEYRGHHLSERAVRLLLPLARAHGLDQVWIGCNPENAASCRTLERLGADYVETIAIPPDYERYYSRGEREKQRYCLDLSHVG